MDSSDVSIQEGGRAQGERRPEDEQAERPRAPFVSVIREWTRSLVVSFIIFLGIRAFIVEAFKIPTSSMENTLLVGDFLLVNKAIYGSRLPGTDLRLPAFKSPERGEVIVFNPPHEPDKNYVKRVVGTPGDTLEMREKVLFVNGRPMREPYARYIDRRGDAVHPGMTWQRGHLVASPTARRYHPSRDTWGPIVIPEDRYFVLGDNRDNSEDSRYWGFVERDAVRGRPWIVYYSFYPERGAAAAWTNSVRWSRLGADIR